MLALAIVTLLVIVALMAAVSRRMLALTLRRLVRTALFVGALDGRVVRRSRASFLGGFGAAVVGLVLYVERCAALRPRGLVEAWRYMRVLHD